MARKVGEDASRPLRGCWVFGHGGDPSGTFDRDQWLDARNVLHVRERAAFAIGVVDGRAGARLQLQPSSLVRPVLGATP